MKKTKESAESLTQQEFLIELKQQLGLKWDDLAQAAGIAPRALKTYRMPITSADYRPMPQVAKVALKSLTKP